MGNARGGAPKPDGRQGGWRLGPLLGGLIGLNLGSTGDLGLDGKSALMAMLLPLAVQWVQRNGGIGGAAALPEKR